MLGNCKKHKNCTITTINTCCLECNDFNKCYDKNCCCDEVSKGIINIKCCEHYIESEKQQMVERKTGKAFRESGLLWFINTTLHMFGWAICWDTETDEIYPARVKYRGFDEDNNTQGYIKVSKYLQENINELVKESQE